MILEEAIGRAQDNVQTQLVHGLLDITVCMQRLEEKLDRIAESVSQRPSSSAAEYVQSVVHRKVTKRGSRRLQHSDSSKNDVEVSGEEGTVCSQSSFKSREQVFGGEGPTDDFVSATGKQPYVMNQLCRGSWSISDHQGAVDSEQQGTVQLSEKQEPAMLIEQEKRAHPLEQEMVLERPAPQVKVDLSFRRKVRKDLDMIQEKSFSHRESWKVAQTPKESFRILDADKKLEVLSESISKKLERIAYALGIRNLNVVDNSADDAEDRKRLMEKLKIAFDSDRRKKLIKKDSDREIWLEYVFGICKPDQRIGRRGSRYSGCASLTCKPLIILAIFMLPLSFNTLSF